jgi:hypothetical protein
MLLRHLLLSGAALQKFWNPSGFSVENGPAICFRLHQEFYVFLFVEVEHNKHHSLVSLSRGNCTQPSARLGSGSVLRYPSSSRFGDKIEVLSINPDDPFPG